jgi:hypothetical protein
MLGYDLCVMRTVVGYIGGQLGSSNRPEQNDYKNPSQSSSSSSSPPPLLLVLLVLLG